MRLPARALDVERWGLRLLLHPLDNGCEKNLLFTPQMYEPVELRELGAEIARERSQPFVFVDIGANVGLFSLYVAALAGANARILAIEPEAGNLARLRFNLDANPGLPIAVLQIALGDAETEAVVEINPRDRGGSYTRAATAADTAASKVRCRPLLSVLREHGVSQVDALKIDVEGAEAKVLVPFFRDAPRELWPRLIIIEDTRALWHLDLFAMLSEFGYHVSARTRLNAVLRMGAR